MPYSSGSLTPAQIASALVEAGLDPLNEELLERFPVFAELLQRWNAKLNLTALRTSEQILRRHFVECIFCAQHLAGGPRTLLDFGSGAGFPGVPIALCRGEIAVTLAEANTRKAAFLREAVRVLGLDAEVYSGRVEAVSPGRAFDCVTMRAVDKPLVAEEAAAARVRPGGTLVLMTTVSTNADGGGVQEDMDRLERLGFAVESRLALPLSRCGVLVQAKRVDAFHVEQS